VKSKEKNIVWIASYPKSGNTWLRLFLSSILNPGKNSIDINDIDSTALIASNRTVFDSISGTNSSNLNCEEIYLIRSLVYEKISSESNETIYIKVHDSWQKNNEEYELFPSDVTKGVILVVRNPFDIAISFSNHSSISIKEAISRMNNMENGLACKKSKLHSQLCQHLGSWSEHFRSWVDHSGLNVHVIKYENMLSRPIQTFSGVLDFLGIEKSLSQVKSSIRECSFSELQDQEKKYGFNEKPIKSEKFFKMGKSHYWKDYLDDDDVISLTDNHSSVLNRLNYFYQ